jgi:hypothetical protein
MQTLQLNNEQLRLLGVCMAVATGLYYGDVNGRAITAEALVELREQDQDVLQRLLTLTLDASLRAAEDAVTSRAPGCRVQP